MHIAESTHWYDRTGKPAYTVKAKDGTDRPTTLRDARKLDLVPSVTTIIKCAAAPGLEMWKANQLMMAALTLPRLQDEPEKDWLSRVAQDSKEHARKAAERGTAIHASVQGYFERGGTKGDAHCTGAADQLFCWLGVDANAWQAEASFSHVMGFGGKVDLSCSRAVVDFKTKEFAEGDDLKTWDEHAMQLAAYRQGLRNPLARCAIVYVSVTNPGLARLIEIPEEDLKRGWECFKALLAYWQAKSKYTSSWQEQKAA